MADRSRQAPPPPGAPPRRAVRRNLFQGLTRRATGSSSTTTATTTTTTTGAAAAAAAASSGAGVANGDGLRLDVDVLSDGGSLPAEIVARNEHGEIELGDLPALVFDEADEAAAAMDDREETKKERQRLAEAVKQHQVNHTAVREQPEELLEAVRASLRAKAAALAEDNWMYEAEPEPPRSY
ncbi:hypothetical protein CTRI78_v000914 [Colletotrichum trifolii]|uniref:Uncharacterized protein n=1 Tax=Colletotrichum trifolii TaxID=5466 RepID=A0A4R8RR33_COLTR|nr:hypothetical protein CTRI78_v000914 [Colletotrichum trifolii]